MEKHTTRYINPDEMMAHAQAVLDYLKIVKEQDRTLYASTVSKYDKLNEMLNECVDEVESLLYPKYSSKVEELRNDNIQSQTEDSNSKDGDIVQESDSTTLDVVQAKNSNSKKIMKSYFAKFKSLPVDMLSVSSNKSVLYCADILSKWFNARFSVKQGTTSKFKYSVSKINTWIDWMIVAYGLSYSKYEQDKFTNQFNDWLETVNDKTMLQYPVFEQVSDINKSDMSITPEAVVIEHLIKESLYDNEFYFDKKHTILDKYRSVWGEELTYEDILQKSSIK